MTEASKEARSRYPDYTLHTTETVDLEDVPLMQREAFEEGVEWAAEFHKSHLQVIMEDLDSLSEGLYDDSNSPDSYF